MLGSAAGTSRGENECGGSRRWHSPSPTQNRRYGLPELPDSSADTVTAKAAISATPPRRITPARPSLSAARPAGYATRSPESPPSMRITPTWAFDPVKFHRYAVSTVPEYTELASPLKTLSTNASRTLRFIAAGNPPLAA